MNRRAPKTRRENMQAIRSKDTKPEMVVRRLVHRMGYRYRLHRRDLPGRPDLVFSGKKKIIFVHGCFWHQHPDENCKVAHRPQSNKEYWEPKLQRNQERDRQNQIALEALGWGVLVLWECELKDETLLMGRLDNFLSEKD